MLNQIHPLSYLGRGQLISFKKDNQEYVLLNVSPDKTHIFVISTEGKIFYKKIKNIIKINRKFILIKNGK